MAEVRFDLVMGLRGFSFRAAIAASLVILPALQGLSAEQLTCWMNSSRQTCTVKPWGKDGFEITFSGSAIFRFTPAGPPTTDRRPMRDEQGRTWLMSGHHSFTLEEQGPNRNRIMVQHDGGTRTK
ncbi:MAG: hypothetical protein VKO44_10775 [Cyanobacteriota bacterium]|nr:hypothetical protein [Cyanobacteriota bacterium]